MFLFVADLAILDVLKEELFLHDHGLPNAKYFAADNGKTNDI